MRVDGRGVRNQKEKKYDYLLLALSSNTIHGPARAHKKVDIQQTEGTQGNKREGCERKNVGDVGYCESYLGVIYPSMRPASSINATTQMESRDLHRNRHQKKEK